MKKYQFILLAGLILPCACTKDFLDKKPDKALLVPTTLTDMQSLLDNSVNVFNKSPYLVIISADDFLTTSAGWQGLTNVNDRNSYIWAKDIYEGRSVGDWTMPFRQIFYANVVLDGLLSIKTEPQDQINRMQGAALFFRAWAYTKLAEQFCSPYDAKDAGVQPGIMLRLSANVNERPGRGTLQQLYKQIINDLTEAAALLPLKSELKTRPSKMAALALLSKVHLLMESYHDALDYALKTLALNDVLLDYNSLNLETSRPFPDPLNQVNEEVLFYSAVANGELFSAVNVVNPDLFKSYEQDDLRRAAFFKDVGNGQVSFKGTYGGTLSGSVFLGIAKDEIYLIAAESAIRTGDINIGITFLNKLLEKRWKKGSFKPIIETDTESALRRVLMERRKELVCRDARWSDLRRLNKDPRFSVTLKRIIDGQVYELPPGDSRYVFPLPSSELSDNIIQNPR
jgi:hypothetical protein